MKRYLLILLTLYCTTLYGQNVSLSDAIVASTTFMNKISVNQHHVVETVAPMYKITLSSINDFENVQQNAEVNIYPNPSNGVFSVNLPTDTIVSIIVYNVQGLKVYTDDNILLHQYTLNLTDFPQGNYIVAVQSHDKTYSSKISKK